MPAASTAARLPNAQRPMNATVATVPAPKITLSNRYEQNQERRTRRRVVADDVESNAGAEPGLPTSESMLVLERWIRIEPAVRELLVSAASTLNRARVSIAAHVDGNPHQIPATFNTNDPRVPIASVARAVAAERRAKLCVRRDDARDEEAAQRREFDRLEGAVQHKAGDHAREAADFSGPHNAQTGRTGEEWSTVPSPLKSKNSSPPILVVEDEQRVGPATRSIRDPDARRRE